jgi:hypothetical protein
MVLPIRKILVNRFFPDKRTRSLILAVLLVMLVTQSLFAQSGRANIGGTVTDSQGAVVGVVIPSTTNDAGLYNIIQIIAGSTLSRWKKKGSVLRKK